LFLVSVIAYIDRVNIGYTALTMNEDLGFNAEVFGLGAGIFFAGYLLFEIPGALIAEKYGPRLWLARIMISWGLVSALMAFMQNAWQFYTLRFLLNETVFAAGETLEFGRHDYAAAALWFRKLARRSEGGVRAAALMRAARNFGKEKNTSGALAVWAELAALEGVSIEGEPASLVARFARLPLLASDPKRTEAELLMRDLQSGRFALSRTSYEFYADELSRMTGLQAPPPLWEEAAHALWSFSRSAGISSGERVIWVRDSEPILLVWRARGDAVAGVASKADRIARWLAGPHDFAFGLKTPDQRTLLATPRGDKQAHRVLSFANTHWRLAAVPRSPAAEAHGRQALLLTGLSLVIILVLTGSYAVVKAVSRELVVARLQSDFVSAASPIPASVSMASAACSSRMGVRNPCRRVTTQSSSSSIGTTAMPARSCRPPTSASDWRP
jgi:hypothetical protein